MYPLELHKNQVVETISEKHMEVILDCIYIYIYIYIYIKIIVLMKLLLILDSNVKFQRSFKTKLSKVSKAKGLPLKGQNVDNIGLWRWNL